jgi:C1A family cysteine protease
VKNRQSVLLGVIVGALGMLTAVVPVQHPSRQVLSAQEVKKPDDKPKVVYGRGHKTPADAVIAQRHADAFKRYGHRMKLLPKATPDKYDLRTLSRTGPIQDQGQCGSCWDVSACGVVTDAFIAGGIFVSTDASLTLSPQYVLDCGSNGGCNGDDAPTVLDMAKSKGLPTTKDYGPYNAGPGRCNTNVTKFYQLKDWGYCTPSQQSGVAATQDIKNAIVQYGTISTAVAADSSWDNPAADGTIPFSNSNSIDHDVAIIG